MPLDGGKVVKTMFFDSNEIINNIFLFLSIAVLTYISISSKSYFLLIIPYFLILQFSTQSQLKKVKAGIAKRGIDLYKSFEDLSDEEYWLIRDELAVHMRYYTKIISPRSYNVSIKEPQIVKQIKSIIQKKPNQDIKVIGKILITLLWILTFIVPVIVIGIYYIKLGLLK
jgi:stage IV sporulation protein FB